MQARHRRCCPQTVARLTQDDGLVSLRVNHKSARPAPRSREPRRSVPPHRRTARVRCAADNIPLISVDTKKKELVGTFRNPGSKWDRSPELVNDHDFRSDADGLAVPYGIYDPRANAGTVFSRQKRRHPRRSPSTASRSGGAPRAASTIPTPRPCRSCSDGMRQQPVAPFCRAWKFEPCQHRLCNRSRFAGHAWPTTRRPRRSGTPVRTPPVLRDQQELGGPPPRQLRHHPEVPAHHPYLHRTARTVAHCVVRKTYKTGVKVKDAESSASSASRRTASCQNGTTPLSPCSKNGIYFCADP